MCIRSQTCEIYMTGFYKYWITARNFALCCLMFLKIFLLLRQSWPSSSVQDKTIVLFASDHRTSLLVQVRHDWNYVSLLRNIVHVPSTENTLTLSLLRKLSVLFASWWLLLFPQLRSGLWHFEFSSSDQQEVLQKSSIVNNLYVHYFERFLDRTKPRQSEAEQSPVILTCTIIPGSHLKANPLRWL